MDDPIYQAFLSAFNAELEKLDCGARVRNSGEAGTMEITDLDGGKPFGRIPIDIEPKAFAAFMLIVEQTFEDGVSFGRGDRETATPTLQ